MRRFAVFAGKYKEPGGGWDNYYGEFKCNFLSTVQIPMRLESVDHMLIERESGISWIQIVDLDRLHIAYVGKRQDALWKWDKLEDDGL